MVMDAKIPALVVALVVVSVGGATGVAAQEVNTEIQFEDEVVVGEETTITYVANVVETPMETDVEVELTLLVDGEEVQTQTTEEEVFDGAELRTEFEHTFDSSGEKEVTVDSVTRAFGQEITDSTTATVSVTEAEDGDNETEDDGTGDMDDGTGDSTDSDDTEDGDGGMEESTGNETDDSTDMEDGTEDGVEDDQTDDGTDTEDGTSEGLPGFGAIAAIVSLAAVAVYTRRRGSD